MIADVHTFMTNEVDVFGAWNILKSKLRYGDEHDDGNNNVWIDLNAIERRLREENEASKPSVWFGVGLSESDNVDSLLTTLKAYV